MSPERNSSCFHSSSESGSSLTNIIGMFRSKLDVVATGTWIIFSVARTVPAISTVRLLLHVLSNIPKIDTYEYFVSLSILSNHHAHLALILISKLASSYRSHKIK